jgi:hypothetical protein
MRNSDPADGKRPSNRATPPNSHRVMPVIFIPSFSARNACPSSCRRMQMKKVRADTTAITM